MPKNRHLLNTKKPETPAENDNETITKTRASRYGRFVRPSKFLPKIEIDNFQLRKALNVYMREELEQLGRKTYFQRVYILAENIDTKKLAEYCENSYVDISDLQQPVYRDYLQHYLDEIFNACEKKKCTTDHLSGLCICMDITHTFVLLEGPEEMLSMVFEELSRVHDKIWFKSRVFLVEDKIGETYFNCFYNRYSPAININEKFPPSTSNDYNLMAVQHLKIKEKLKNLVETLGKQLTKSTQESSEETPKQTPADPFLLPQDPYNKLLPEIQRIDLVLNSNKFYYNIKDFAITYRVIATHQDEEALFWPIQNNYTPLDIFQRSQFDVNLTFGNYGKDEQEQEQKKQENSSHDNMMIVEDDQQQQETQE